MEFLDFFRDYPAIGGAAIALFGTFIGGFGSYIFQLYNEKLKHKRELRLFLLKEKINAAKKASEFYLEQLNYYNLLYHQLEFLSSTDSPNIQMITDLDSEVQQHAQKLKNFPHFEHHHINIFYEVDDRKSIELNTETFELNQEILNIRVGEEDALEVMEQKIAQITQKANRLKEIYADHYEILKQYISNIREDINNT